MQHVELHMTNNTKGSREVTASQTVCVTIVAGLCMHSVGDVENVKTCPLCLVPNQLPSQFYNTGTAANKTDLPVH